MPFHTSDEEGEKQTGKLKKHLVRRLLPFPLLPLVFCVCCVCVLILEFIPSHTRTYTHAQRQTFDPGSKSLNAFCGFVFTLNGIAKPKTKPQIQTKKKPLTLLHIPFPVRLPTSLTVLNFTHHLPKAAFWVSSDLFLWCERNFATLRLCGLCFVPPKCLFKIKTNRYTHTYTDMTVVRLRI